MKRHLYFICPTDNLEPVINNTFKQENYYLTSLGNSIEFNADMVSQLNELLRTRNIRDISFVLSDNNRFVSDALGKKDYLGVTGLRNFYHQIAKQKEHSEGVWQTYNRQFLILSYHLNDKIKELRLGLQCLPIGAFKIHGKIYNTDNDAFSDIYPGLICRDCVGVN